VLNRVLMPETTVDENHGALACENQVRFARKILPMESVSVSELMSEAPNDHLGACIFTPDRSHDFASALTCEGVGHVVK